LDIKGETTTEFRLNEKIQESLVSYLHELIVPGLDIKIDMKWSGIMAFGKDKLPIIKNVSPRTIAGIRMGGMGLALSGITASQMKGFGGIISIEFWSNPLNNHG